MKASLNLTKPTIVLPGAWNTAIFSPEWIARFLHGYEEGQNVETNILQEVPTGKKIFFIENIGISPTTARLEIFARSVDEFPALGAYVRKIYEALPHTPCGSFGVNFRYISQEVAPEVIEKLETSEGLEVDFEIRRQELKTQLVRDDSSIINLTRTYVQGSFEIDMNFHFGIDNNIEIISALEGGTVHNCREISEEMLDKYYEIDEIDVIGFELQDLE